LPIFIKQFRLSYGGFNLTLKYSNKTWMDRTMKKIGEVRTATLSAVNSAESWISASFLLGLFLLIAWRIVAG